MTRIEIYTALVAAEITYGGVVALTSSTTKNREISKIVDRIIEIDEIYKQNKKEVNNG